ncbi:EAL domain-containing protein [Vibrio hippocampi]|uniref:Sensor domain-containing phosphodiesterase n=1 Tax=Vibrio hippocampi TaxID=654686 RepID=A0ABN8DFS2_9VIBR|nr:EAL domain-containing protein [Vibrio hippocampi]CAH0526028.1 hypothetical protein VHP8226_01512 [Vibrio hippocampi]
MNMVFQDEIPLSRYLSLFETKDEGLFLIDSSANIKFYNSLFYHQFAIESDTVSAEQWLSLVYPEDQQALQNNIESLKQGRVESICSQYQLRVRKRDGQYAWIEASVSYKQDNLGHYIVGRHREVTEKIKLQSSLKRLAFYDKQSGLPNHEQLKRHLNQRQTETTLLKIRLGRLETYLYRYGDAIISKVVECLKSCLSIFVDIPHTLYRSGTDSFILLFDVKVTESTLAMMCQGILRQFEIQSYESVYTGKIFIGAYTNYDLEQSADDILMITEQTLNYVTDNVVEQYVIFNNDIRNSIERYVYIENHLKSAIEQDQITIQLQPIVCGRTNAVISFEALARWLDTPFGPIGPHEFVLVAERSGLVNALGEKVLKQACEFILRYNQKWDTQVSVNVNISVLQLLDGNFPLYAAQILEELGVASHLVKLEVTESILLDDKQLAVEQLGKLRQLGFELIIDDFGSGASSTMSLFNLPFSQIKIDRMLATAAMTDRDCLSYIHYITHLCANKGIDVTVEGVEDLAMYQCFIQCRVSKLQGYYLSYPLRDVDALNIDYQHCVSDSQFVE